MGRFERQRVEDLFNQLPGTIRYQNGQFIGEFDLVVTKANDAVCVMYKDASGKWLQGTYRKGPTLKEALIDALQWIKLCKFEEFE